jgi:hypothetical protein
MYDIYRIFSSLRKKKDSWNIYHVIYSLISNILSRLYGFSPKRII